MVGGQAFEENPTRLLPEQELDFLSNKEMRNKKVESLHVEYLQRNTKMFALIRYVVRDNKTHSLKTVMRIFNFVKPFKTDEINMKD